MSHAENHNAPDTERSRMLRGELYLASDSELVAARAHARRLTRLFNQSAEDQTIHRASLLAKLFGTLGGNVTIEPPFHCDYGSNIRLADSVYMNFGCVLLDCNTITIGRATLIGHGVHICAATHPLTPALRAAGRELALPVSIGDNVWIGGGAIICPGVTIGDNAVIGAGSVATRPIPANHVAVGNPCRPIRQI